MTDYIAMAISEVSVDFPDYQRANVHALIAIAQELRKMNERAVREVCDHNWETEGHVGVGWGPSGYHDDSEAHYVCTKCGATAKEVGPAFNGEPIELQKIDIEQER